MGLLRADRRAGSSFRALSPPPSATPRGRRRLAFFVTKPFDADALRELLRNERYDSLRRASEKIYQDQSKYQEERMRLLIKQQNATPTLPARPRNGWHPLTLAMAEGLPILERPGNQLRYRVEHHGGLGALNR